jgi:hypothetical protein
MNVSANIGRLLFLGVGIIAALVMSVTAASLREPGLAVSAIGVALLGVVGFLEPGPLVQPFGGRFLKVESANSQTILIAGVGVLLVLVGLGVRVVAW